MGNSVVFFTVASVHVMMDMMECYNEGNDDLHKFPKITKIRIQVEKRYSHDVVHFCELGSIAVNYQTKERVHFSVRTYHWSVSMI